MTTNVKGARRQRGHDGIILGVVRLSQLTSPPGVLFPGATRLRSRLGTVGCAFVDAFALAEKKFVNMDPFPCGSLSLSLSLWPSFCMTESAESMHSHGSRL